MMSHISPWKLTSSAQAPCLRSKARNPPDLVSFPFPLLSDTSVGGRRTLPRRIRSTECNRHRLVCLPPPPLFLPSDAAPTTSPPPLQVCWTSLYALQICSESIQRPSPLRPELSGEPCSEISPPLFALLFLFLLSPETNLRSYQRSPY
jgi:hypothetical protein